jgi:hypothetical protein
MKINPAKVQVPHYFFSIFSEFDLDQNIDKYPSDYLKFIQTHGEGLMGGYIRIFAPHIAEAIESRWKKGFGKYIQETYFDGLPFLESVLLIGDSIDCDQIFYFVNDYYVFSVEGDEGYFENLGPNLSEVIEFYKSGKYWEPIDMENFTPFNSSWIFNGLMSLNSLLKN